MNLKDFEVKPHKAREIFRRHKVPLKVVARATGISYNYLVAQLSGSLNPTPETEKKLRALCEQLERD
jgi:hypothetical protein